MQRKWAHRTVLLAILISLSWALRPGGRWELPTALLSSIVRFQTRPDSQLHDAMCCHGHTCYLPTVSSWPASPMVSQASAVRKSLARAILLLLFLLMSNAGWPLYGQVSQRKASPSPHCMQHTCQEKHNALLHSACWSAICHTKGGIWQSGAA